MMPLLFVTFCFCGTAAVHFTSVDLRVVPLTTCAKIIHIDPTRHTKVVYNLGIEEAIAGADNGALTTVDQKVKINFLRSLCAYHKLLYQLVQYMGNIHHSEGYAGVDEGASDAPSVVPYPMGQDRIGWMQLSDNSTLSDEDWSTIIHMIVSNLQWVSSLVTV